jgi:hypothetical protein
MTDYSLLKEFLESGLTQKAFAEHKQANYNWMNKKLWLQMNNLYKDNIVIPGMYAYEVRYAQKHKEKILKAISNFYTK